MNDCEYRNPVPAQSRDIYLELMLIEMRGERMSERRSLVTAFIRFARGLTERLAARSARRRPAPEAES